MPIFTVILIVQLIKQQTFVNLITLSIVLDIKCSIEQKGKALWKHRFKWYRSIIVS